MPAPATLVLETSTPHASIAVVGEDGAVEQRGFCSDRNHNAMLFEPLQELLAGDRGIRLVLVGSGPGSYSGTRVGIAAAQGVAIALGCPAVAVPSILAVPSADGGAACLAIGDARRGSYWTARVENHRVIGEPALCDAAELAAIVEKALDENLAVFAFEGAAVAFAGAMVGPRTPILTSMGFEEVIMTFVVVVLGGIGSVGGSYLAGLALGLFTAFFGALVSPAYTTAAAFMVLIAVLVLRPGGLATRAR